MPSNPIASQINLSEPLKSSDRPAEQTWILYFITGNPGLIEYYRTFFTHLYGLLSQQSQNSSSSTMDFQIFGRSLLGFEVGLPDTQDRERKKGPPYGLQEQITSCQEELEGLLERVRKSTKTADVRVILMGHSVGSYMVLEIIRRLRGRVPTSRETVPRIVGGVCLFPTVTHIAQSASGRKSSWLLTRRPLTFAASILAKTLTFLIPTSLFALIIQAVLSFPSDAAKVTTAFVKSKHGVRQALYMAGDEMRQITTDTWDAEIWGATHPSSHQHPRPILRFLFAKEDHWVANETRDELIKARGRNGGRGEEDGAEEWKPVMDVDEKEGWPHGFCIRHSVPVAERVYGYIRDIVERDLKRE